MKARQLEALSKVQRQLVRIYQHELDSLLNLQAWNGGGLEDWQKERLRYLRGRVKELSV